MARHDKDEAKRQTEPLRYYYDTLDRPKGLRQEGAHIKVYAAHGSHASYPRCDEFPRSDPKRYGDLLPNDNTCRGPVKTFGTDTRLINVARSPWACWQGRFGEPGPSQSIKMGAPVVCVEALDAQARSAPRISWKLRAAAALSATGG